MSSVAVIAACLVPCFISVANPWFYTAKCGQGGCPMCHKAAQRGRAGVEASAMELDAQARQVAAEIPARARGMFGWQEPVEEKEKKSWFRRGCGWEEENVEAEQQGAAEMQAATGGSVMESRSRDSAGVVPNSEQHRTTQPMRIPHTGSQEESGGGSPVTSAEEAGASFGVDVSHLAPEPLPFGATPEERLIEKNSKPEGGKGKQVRPSLDEAISWDRLAGTSKPETKRKWWYMP